MMIIKKFPFLTYGILALFIQLVILAVQPQYDDGSLTAALLISSPVWGVIFWLPHEMLYSVNNGLSFSGQTLLSIIIGLSICFVADTLLNKIRQRKHAN
jgi:hypothetical protein